MRAAKAAGQPDDRAAGTLGPVRRAETREGRHDITARAVGHGFGELLALLGVGDDGQLVAQPLDRGARDEHTALKGIFHMILKADGDRRDEAAAAHDGLAAGVHQKEAARAVGVLHLTGLEAALAEQSALLVARGAGNRDLAAVELKGAVAVHMARGLDLRQHARGDVEQLKQFGIPAEVVDVVEHRAAGVGLVGDVDVAVRQLPDQPGVDRAEEQLASLSPLACAGHVVQQPFDLRAGEIRVRHETRLGADLIAPARLDDAVDDVGGAAALPDDGVGDRLAGGLVPDHGRLALVGDADGGNVCGRDAELAHRAA